MPTQMNHTADAGVPRKPLSMLGTEPAPTIADYRDVPWHRRQWATVPILTLLLPVGVVITLTGDIYLKATGKARRYSPAVAWRYGFGAKAFVIAVAVLFNVIVLVNLVG